MGNIKILNNLKSDLQGWLKTIYIGSGTYKFAAHAIRPSCVDATSLAVDLENMLGNSLLDKRDLILCYLNSHQDPKDGFFFEDFEEELEENQITRIREMARTYLSFQTCGAYRVLDEKPQFEFSFYKNLKDSQKMNEYMENNMPWNQNPWGAGGMVDSVSTMVTMNIENGFDYSEALETMFKWLNKHQDRETGLWGNIQAQGLAGLVNGGYHLIRGTYIYHKRELHYTKKIIDSILAHINQCSLFTKGQGDGCYDLDAFFLLSECFSMEKNYRKSEIEEICRKRLTSLNCLKRKDGGFSFESDGATTNHNYFHVTEGKLESDIQGSVFYLQTILSIMRILNPNKNLGFHYSITHGKILL